MEARCWHGGWGRSAKAEAKVGTPHPFLPARMCRTSLTTWHLMVTGTTSTALQLLPQQQPSLLSPSHFGWRPSPRADVIQLSRQVSYDDFYPMQRRSVSGPFPGWYWDLLADTALSDVEADAFRIKFAGFLREWSGQSTEEAGSVQPDINWMQRFGAPFSYVVCRANSRAHHFALCTICLRRVFPHQASVGDHKVSRMCMCM